MTDRPDGPDAQDQTQDESGTTVLDLFGIKLNVRNPRLAEILLMDAKEALTTDVRRLGDPAAIRALADEAREAAPDVVMTPSTPRDDYEADARAEMKSRVDALADALGFERAEQGTWQSPSGVSVLVRAVPAEITFAAATDFAGKLEVIRSARVGVDDAALFVTHDRRGADIFRIAIRQQRLYANMRTIALEDLERLRTAVADGHLDHDRIVAMLVPSASIDIRFLLPES